MRGGGSIEVERVQAEPRSPAVDVVLWRLRKREAAESMLERDLPCGERAQVDLVRRVAARAACRRRELRIVGGEPQEGAGVDEELHSRLPRPSNASRSPSGRGSKKLGGTTMPRSMPTRRSFSAGFRSGRSSAIGTFRRQTTIVSPASTRSMRLERFALRPCQRLGSKPASARCPRAPYNANCIT
jgi:hypothetical protein